MKKIFLTLAVAITSYCSQAQYLPLTAGSGNPLTGDLHIDGTNGNRVIFSYGGVSNNKVLLGSTYSIFGAGSKDDFATYIKDNNSYAIWTNNLQRLTVDGSGNVGIGTASPLSLFSVGSSSQFQVSSSGNTTVGGNLNVAGTLQSYGPGAFDSNTAIGDLALSANTTGTWNVAIGRGAGGSFQTGMYNVFVGGQAGGIGTGTGSYNNAIGFSALRNVSSGTYNNAFGAGAGGTITTGIGNTMMGDAAGINVTTTNYNTGIGLNAGNNSNGANWTAVGALALQSGAVSGKDGSTAVGMQALQITTGSYNTAIGIKAGYDINTGSTLTGSYNNYLGTYAGQGNITGSYNTFIGYNSSLGSVNNYVIIADGQGHNRIVSDNNGNVGIGTSTPAVSLDVIGSAQFTNAITTKGVSGLFFGDSGTYNQYSGIYPSNGANDINIKGYASSTIHFGFSNTTGADISTLEAVTIKANGNVGIGTTDPQGYKLAVNGSVIATSVKVKAYGSWPDYVFKKDHDLMPLADLKAYVDKNQHLPEIPSAAEVEKNGQDLGEMNKILVKKVEELTLYLIEKDKQDKARQKEVDELKKQVETLMKASQKK